jgi:hypothetical protein
MKWKQYPRRDGDGGWALFYTLCAVAMICVIVLFARVT